MSVPDTIASTSTITFPNVDSVSQYIPVASTILNSFVLYEKFIHRNECIIDNLGDRKIRYIQTKNMTRTLIGLIPIFGNAILLLDLLRTKIFGLQHTDLNSDVFQDYYNRAGSKQTKGFYSLDQLNAEQVRRIAAALSKNEYVFCKTQSKKSEGINSWTEYYDLFITSETTLRIDPKTVIKLSSWARDEFPLTYETFEELFEEKFPNIPLSEIKRRNGDDFL